MSRLPAPYGDCVPDGKTSDYIYSNYEYSVEVNSKQNLSKFSRKNGS